MSVISPFALGCCADSTDVNVNWLLSAGSVQARTETADSRLGAMHLQWFAAEDEGRTEDPTDHKMKEARKEGKVAKSAELTSTIVLLFCAIGLAALGPGIFGNMKSMLIYFLEQSTSIDVTTSSKVFAAFMEYLVAIVAPIAAIAFVAALLGNFLQVGFLFTTKPIVPDFSKIVPKFGKFIQRAFGSIETLFNLAKSFIKVGIIGGIAYINISASIDGLVNNIRVDYSAAFTMILQIAFNIFIQASIVMLFVSLADYLFQRRQHIESLKMSKQEIKEERKTYEGDPLIKSRMKERMREILSNNMMQKVPEADVVVTNPTHFAVAMEYNREAMQAPLVTAKGHDELALRIKGLAKDSGVPVVENKPLARALYAEVEVGDTIPEKYYQVVATVLSEVYKMKDDRQ